MRRVATSLLGATASPWRHASTSKDYYDVLGIPRTASPQDIKKAYRKRAMETHPDQGGNTDDFAAVSAAYEVLSNPEKRQVYDSAGKEGLDGMGPAGTAHRNPADIFADFFGGFSKHSQRPERAEDVEADVVLTLEEVHKGVTKRVHFRRPTVCGTCRGHGTRSGKAMPVCTTCKGSGQVMQQHSSMGMLGHMVSACPTCHGLGKKPDPADVCGGCGGTGRSEEAAEWEVRIPAGMPSNQAIAEQGMGGRAMGLGNGHLIVSVTVAPHHTFTRRGNDLLCEMTLTLAEAMLGTERTIKLLDGKEYTVNFPKGPLPLDAVLRIAGKGLPLLDGDGHGDLIIMTRTELPKHLTDAQRKALRDAFGTPTPPPTADGKARPSLTATLLPGGRQRTQAGGDDPHGGGGGRRRGRHSGGSQQECQVQ